MSGNGWCTHPKRQVSSDVRILVRKGELACRNSWGGDLWTSAEAQAFGPDSGPAAPGSAFIANEHTEDQVTSVRASGPSRSGTDSVVFSEPSFRAETREDIIVDHASVRTNDAGPRRASQSRGDVDDDSLNIPAQEDQQERARIIARGSRDAILRARERHTQRRKGADRLHPPMGQDDTPNESDDSRVTPTSDQEQEAAASHAGAESIATPDDNVVRGNLRFGRRAHLTDETSERSDQKASVPAEFIRPYGDPTPPVPPDDVRRDPHNMVVRKTDRDRFETVPEIKPDIELPRIRQFLQTGEGAGKGIDPGAADAGDSTPVNSYDLVLRRAQAIKDASRAERRGRGGGLPRKAPITSSAPTLPAEQPETRGRRSERINHLPEIEWDVDADAADESFARGRLPDLDTDDIVSGRHHDDRSRSHASDTDLLEVVDNPAWDNDDDPRLDNDRDPFTRPSTTADHRQNWWRGLTFGRARNQTVHVGPDDDDDPYRAAHTDDSIEDEIDFETYRAADTFHDDEFEDAVAEPAEPMVVRRDRAATGPSAATSERRSDRPEPRHPSWAPFDEVENTPLRRKRIRTPSPATVHTVDPERDGGRSTRGTRPVRATAFALRDEREMDAFRSALFRDERGPEGPSTTPASQPGARNDETVAIRQTTATAAPRASRRPSYRPLEEQVREPAPLRHAAVERADDPFQDETFDIRDLVEHGDDVLDMTIELAPELPRMCQTCRDFRPSESGERGWCTNDWAFTHRQMVNAESLPCQSSIGCWWLPNDASWLPALDPSERKVPTPRIDRLVAQSRLHDISRQEEHQELYVREI